MTAGFDFEPIALVKQHQHTQLCPINCLAIIIGHIFAEKPPVWFSKHMTRNHVRALSKSCKIYDSARGSADVHAHTCCQGHSQRCMGQWGKPKDPPSFRRP